MQPAVFEVWLQGGFRINWGTIAPTVYGCLDILAAPEFCPIDRFPGIYDLEKDGAWELWPIDNPARPNPLLQADEFCRPVHITSRTLAVALVTVQPGVGQETHSLWVELFLSATEPAQNGLSVLEDWAAILHSSKDDPGKRAVLRLNFGIVTPVEAAGFNSGKKLVTSDLALEVLPRPVASNL
jgi:hypothetical protein